MTDVYEKCLKNLIEQDNGANIRMKIADSKFCPEDIRKTLLKDSNVCVRETIASSLETTNEMLSFIIRNDDSAIVVKSAIQNPKTTSNDIRYAYKKWKEDKSYNRISYHIAAHNNTPLDILEEMLSKISNRPNKLNVSFLVNIASNPNATKELLNNMLKKRSSRLHEAIAAHPNISNEKMEGFFKDTNPFIRKGLARNPRCPQEYIEAYATDRSGFVREVIAAHPITTSEMLEKLAEDPVWQVRKAVGENPKTPETVLLKLASNVTYGKVLIAIAKNKNLGKLMEVLGKLIEGGKRQILMEVYENESVTQSQKDMLFMLTGLSYEDCSHCFWN